MLILHVNVHVKAESVAAFQAATIENARNSRKEPGIARFDVVQQSDDPTRFVLVEAYRDAAAQASHKETPHYHKWVAAVTDLLAEPRTRQTYKNIDPEDSGW